MGVDQAGESWCTSAQCVAPPIVCTLAWSGGTHIFVGFFARRPEFCWFRAHRQLNACLLCACRPGWGPCMSQEAPSGHICNIYLSICVAIATSDTDR